MNDEDKTKDQFINELKKLRQRIAELEKSETEHKLVEESLKESEEKYKTLIETTQEGIGIVDPEENIVFVNQTFADFLGYQKEELLGMNLSQLTDKKEFVKYQEETKKRKQMESFKYETKLYTKNGKSKHFSLSATPLQKDGAFVGTLGLLVDITKRKQADAALRRSQERYKTLAENVNVGLYRNTVGPKGRFIEANPAIIKMFGYENKEEFLLINVADLYQDPDDRKKFNDKMLKVGFVKDEELLLKKKDGIPFYGSVSAVAVKGERDEVKYYDGIIENITERKKAEEELKLSYERLQKILDGTVSALASTTEKRDPYTAGHQHRVTQLACAIAKEMGLPKEQIDGIRVAGIVHDIGKIHVAAEILNKPVKLKDIEMELIKTHCEAGYEILKTIEFPWPVAEIVRQHHERMNGSGYPRGLIGEDILLEARILAVADVVEAMISHRPYRSALSLNEALKETSKNRGKLFDPNVADACLRLFEKGFNFK